MRILLDAYCPRRDVALTDGAYKLPIPVGLAA